MMPAPSSAKLKKVVGPRWRAMTVRERSSSSTERCGMRPLLSLRSSAKMARRSRPASSKGVSKVCQAMSSRKWNAAATQQRRGCGQRYPCTAAASLCAATLVCTDWCQIGTQPACGKDPQAEVLVDCSSQDADAYLTCDTVRRCDLQKGRNLLLKLHVAPSSSKPLNQNAIQATPVNRNWSEPSLAPMLNDLFDSGKAAPAVCRPIPATALPCMHLYAHALYPSGDALQALSCTESWSIYR